MFLVVIIAATFALNFVFKLGDYLPGTGKKAGQGSAQPSRR